MANIFNSIRLKRPRRNVFYLSYENKLTANAGELVPIMCKPVVPGDKFRVNTEMLVRLAPLVAPMMHRVDVFTHYFFVPNRLLWNQWEDFITKGVDGTDVPAFPKIALRADWVNPTSAAALLSDGSLWDYLGLPTIGGFNGIAFPERSPNSVIPPVGYEVSALPFRAYQLIYNEYYRDQNLTQPIDFTLDGGLVTNVTEVMSLLTLRRRAWEKDYFTSALPWVQRGPDVTVPVNNNSGSLDVVLKDSPHADVYHVPGTTAFPKDGALRSISGALVIGGGEPDPAYLEPSNFQVNVDELGVSINDLRTSNALQRWFERNARSGSRYIEQILSHFGVRSSDARLQRPQFLGGGRTPVSVSEVLQTSSTDTTSPQANMAGHGISAGVNHGFKRYFEEHGYIIGIMSIRPRTGYQQGVPKDFRKFDNMDFYFPEFAHLGEQEIKNEELYLQQTPAGNDGVFGYTPRYAEYKYSMNEVHGDFRGNMAFWHLNRIFSESPNLNTTFVECNPSNRVFATADTSDDKYWIQLYQDVKALRLMPKYGTPTL
ncbi:MAG: major capsid protein [Parabacteroides distasonis]|uniref:Capsid protein n=1 Tax=Phage sp. ctKpL5 TaxID=2828004 RepID=A0A8S5TMU9_9VIRU|nr:MAG TPA: Capsid protein [Phage sp. ctKpL5]